MRNLSLQSYRTTTPLVLLLALLSAGVGRTTAADSIEVQTLDGRRTRGQLLAWDQQGVRLATASGESTLLAYDQLLFVACAASKTAGPAAVELVLRDGSQIGGEQLQIDGDKIVVIPTALDGESNREPWTFAAGQLRAARLQWPQDIDASVARELASQWRSMVAATQTADLLVIRKPGTEVLQVVEGAVGGVGPDKVEFTLGDEQVKVDRSRVYGVVFFGDTNNERAAGVVLQTTSGHRVAGAQIVVSGDELLLNRQGDVAIRFALGDVASVDYSPGRLVYLSSLEPHRVDITSPIVEPDGLVAAWWQPRRDLNFAGEKLQLAFPPDGERAGGGVPRLQTYERGLALRGPGQVVYRLPSGYRRLVAVVGIDPTIRQTAAATWQIESRGSLLAEGRCDRQRPPSEVEIDIEGLREITLTIARDAATDAGAVVIQFCDARLLK